MPTDASASAAAQANAHACLLDALEFIGFDDGGHTWVGHDAEVMDAIGTWVLNAGRPSLPSLPSPSCRP